jgi:hypothetical protein
LNYAITDRDGAAIESNFGHGVGVGNQREQTIFPIYHGIRKPDLSLVVIGAGSWLFAKDEDI